MVVRLAGLAVLVLVIPLAAAALPPAVVLDPEAEIVSDYAYYNYDAQHGCTTGHPIVSLASTALTSRLSHGTRDGRTDFALHLDAVPGDLQCPALDLEFTADVVYPGTPYGTFVPFTAECGASGYVGIFERASGTTFSFALSSAPGACGVPGGYLAGHFEIVRTVAGPALVCSPMVALGCVGVQESVPQQQDGECDGQTSTTSVIVLVELVYAQRQCQPWNDDRDHVIVRDSFFGFMTLDATEDSCTVREGLGGTELSCPDEVGALLLGVEWGRVLA